MQTEFDVDAIGRVIPGSVRMVGTHGGHLSGEISNDVVRIAESCAYQPARRKGDPVRVRGVRRTFIIET